jgi:hypothetical protein
MPQIPYSKGTHYQHPDNRKQCIKKKLKNETVTSGWGKTSINKRLPMGPFENTTCCTTFQPKWIAMGTYSELVFV